MVNILEAIRAAQIKEVDILNLPELCITGYGCQDVFLAKWVAEKALEKLQAIIPHTENITVSLGLPIWYEGVLYNGVACVSDRKLLGITAKQNLANDGVYYETRWFSPWKSGQQAVLDFNGENIRFGDLIYEVCGVRMAFEICEDAWVENRPACRFVTQNVQLVLNPSASHFTFGKTGVRERLMADSSRKFDCTYLFTNMLGNEAGRMIYEGDVILAQKGKIIKRNKWLSFDNVSLLTAEVNIDTDQNKEAEEYQSNRNEEFAQAVALGLFDYMRKSKSKGFVVSLSGGADSACCAVLICEMVKRGVKELGVEEFARKAGRDEWAHLSADEIITEALTCIYQAADNSSDDTFAAARGLALSVNASFSNWDISAEVSGINNKVEKVLGRKLTWAQDDIALQNVQARMRSPGIWMLANIKNALLITTSNRSEGDVGYATMDGDMSGSLAPLAGVDKPFVRQWLLWAEEELGYEGLKQINKLAPTAELRPPGDHQTDEDDLMPYDVLVEIERLAVFKRHSPMEVFDVLKRNLTLPPELLKEFISRFYRLWSVNQWKRERMAPSFHLDDFNIDPKTWCRFPILSRAFQQEIDELKMEN